MRTEGLEPRLDAGELAFELGQVRGDGGRISIAKRAELVCDAALDLTCLATEIRVALRSRRECFRELIFEPLQRVRYDFRMQNSFLDASQELALEILPTNQGIIFADGVPALRVHRTSVAVSVGTIIADRRTDPRKRVYTHGSYER